MHLRPSPVNRRPCRRDIASKKQQGRCRSSRSRGSIFPASSLPDMLFTRRRSHRYHRSDIVHPFHAGQLGGSYWLTPLGHISTGTRRQAVATPGPALPASEFSFTRDGVSGRSSQRATNSPRPGCPSFWTHPLQPCPARRHPFRPTGIVPSLSKHFLFPFGHQQEFRRHKDRVRGPDPAGG